MNLFGHCLDIRDAFIESIVHEFMEVIYYESSIDIDICIRICIRNLKISNKNS